MAMYRFLLVTILCLFVTFGFSQQYTPMTAAGYQMKRIKADSTLHIPSFCGVPTLRNSTAKDGAIAMDTCNNKLYKWTNANGWSEISGGGVSQDLASVLNVGNKGYKNIELLPVNGSNNSVVISPNDNSGFPEFSLNDSIGQSITLQTQTKYDAPVITLQKNSDYQSLLFNDGSFGKVYLPNQRYNLPNTMEDTLASLRDLRQNTSGGTVISVATGYGLSGGTITTSGTIIVDSATLSNKYFRISDTSNKWVNNITRTSGKDSIIYYIGSNRYAIKDSVGTFTQTGRFGNDTATIVMAKVHNDAGVQLTNGKVVFLGTSGTSSDVPSVRLANNKSDSTSANTFGFVSGTINVNDTGWIILSGKIEKLNTSAFSNGDIIYLDSVSGNWTKSKPVAPYHMVYLGVVVKANAGNGSIFVKCQNGYELDEIHDVQISGKVNNNIIVYSDTQKVWKNRSIYSVVDTVNTIATKSNVALKVNISDTANMLTNYAKTSAVNLKVNISDTTNMLSKYLRKTDTLTLSNRIDLKQNTLTNPVTGTGTPLTIAKFSGASTIQSATADQDYLTQDVTTLAFQAMGSSIKGVTLDCPSPHFITNTVASTSQTVYFVACYIPKATSITGVRFYVGNQQTATANNYNGVGIYSVSGGTLTLQASSNNDATLFIGGNNAWYSKAFSTPFSASQGLYYIAVLSSTSGTAPQFGAATNTATNANIKSFDFTNSNKISATLASQTSLPSPTVALSSLTLNVTNYAFYLYGN